MHWCSIGSILYGAVLVIESRHGKLLVLCVFSASELTIELASHLYRRCIPKFTAQVVILVRSVVFLTPPAYLLSPRSSCYIIIGEDCFRAVA